MKRVVITGVGMHSPMGSDPGEVFDAILRGEHGIRRMPEWSEIDELKTCVGAVIPDFSARHIPRKTRRTMGRVALLAVSAAERAAQGAGLDEELLRSQRTAVIVGSTAGSASAERDFWEQVLKKTRRGIRSTLFFQGMAHTCATNVALHLGVVGEVFATNSACSSANQAIGLAADRIRMGRADVVLAGGAEEVHVSAPIIFDALGAATRTVDPDHTPRLFQADRDGIVVGEGAGIVVLESLEHAKARGANILGEILGFGTACDAMHMARAAPQGMVTAIQRCLEDAGVSADEVDHINAHATGTQGGDAAESEALHTVFGDRPSVVSLKGHLGHTLGACGALELILSLESMRRGVVPSTRGLVEPGPSIAPIRLLTEPREERVQRVLKSNFAFG
ncbi:MAG: hypothetical protein KC912_21840, partial [Proteobacteria bacterium]|nr:hypothetical protein [Pseudomonadota bacterium]